MSSIMGQGGGMFSGGQGYSLGLGLASLFGGAQADVSTAYSPGTMNTLWGMQQQSIDQDVAMQNEQADIALQESIFAARKTAREGLEFRETQAKAYNSSGFLLEGSPMDTLNSTRNLVNEEVDAISRRGVAQTNLIRGQANRTANEGRAQILGQQIKYSSDRASAESANIANRPNFALNAAKFVGTMFNTANSGTSKYNPSASTSATGTYGAGGYGTSGYMPMGYGNYNDPAGGY